MQSMIQRDGRASEGDGLGDEAGHHAGIGGSGRPVGCAVVRESVTSRHLCALWRGSLGTPARASRLVKALLA